MLNNRTRFSLALTLLIGLFLINTSYTDADLFAQRTVNQNRFSMSTLSFLSRNTATNQDQSRLFDINGIVPGGFAVDSFRIKNDGKLNFNYRLKGSMVGGDNLFCQSLQLVLIRDKNQVQSSLVDLVYDSSIGTNESQDWVVYVKFDNHDLVLRNKICQFDLVLRSWRNDPNSTGGIFAQKQLSSFISSTI